MKQQELLQLISKYFSRFSEQVKILNKNGEFSINIHAENVLIKILNIVFSADFENVNYVEAKNYNSIDLRDKFGQLSIQITATSGIKKVKDTLEKYVKNKHYEKYKALKILIITGRQEQYSQEAIDRIVNPNYAFNGGKDIIDFSTLYLLLNKQNDLSKILAIKELLESQFSDIATNIEEPPIESFTQLCKIILPYLKDNERVFSAFGPNSGVNNQQPLRWDMTLWYKVRREQLLPNNSIISNLISEYKALIPKVHLKIFEDFLAHGYAFEKHCEDANFDYSQYLFPKEIIRIVNEESSN
ncbi:MAG TPA: SMEK domain-containing protein [Mucilaginibacter sp.]|nr:SMEK domain-containing protein [Mucilaginibacter sp.]